MMLASPIAVAGSISNPHVDDDTGEADPRFPAHEAIPGPSIPQSVDIDKAKITSDSGAIYFEIQVASLFVPHTLAGGPSLFLTQENDVVYEVRVDVADDVFTTGGCGGANPELRVTVSPDNGVLWPAEADFTPNNFDSRAFCSSDAGGAWVTGFLAGDIDRGDAKITIELPRDASWNEGYQLSSGSTFSNPTVLTYEDNFLNSYVYDVASSDAVIET